MQWRRDGGGEGVFAPGGTFQGAAFEGRKYGILKIGRFWQIDVCIAVSQNGFKGWFVS